VDSDETRIGLDNLLLTMMQKRHECGIDECGQQIIKA
jgi:hypothetical protein